MKMKKNLHPALVPWLKEFHENANRKLAEGFKATPTNGREFLANLTRRYVTVIPDIAYIQDDMAPAGNYSVPVRIYHPAPAKALPVLLYFHGGGHMCGSVSVYDPICRKLALAAEHIVVSVDYRLSPENPYPAGMNDALGVARTVWNVLEGRKINYIRELSISGDSAGGALCACVSGLTQFEPAVKIKRQVLIYPGLDYTMSMPSIEENAVGFLLQKAKLEWYFGCYLQNNENWKAVSPLFWDFTARLPETLVITAGFCPLRDEGIAYCKKVQDAGVRARHINFEDMVHTYICMEDLAPDACRKTYEAIASFLKE
jgi:acetyl esterase/lipase